LTCDNILTKSVNMSTSVTQADIRTAPDASADEAKRARILAAAMKAFLAYGFSRVTMDQIAQAANMSRPALYLMFKNKADIFRALAVSLFAQSVERARQALEAPGTFGERVNTAIDGCMISMFAEIACSPHGADLIDAKSTLSDEIVSGWKRDLGVLIQRSVEDEARRTGVDLGENDLSAEILAQFLLDGIEGMKHRLIDADQQRKAVRGLVKIVERALQP
jgi:AcrR family transcriptional regulator